MSVTNDDTKQAERGDGAVGTSWLHDLMERERRDQKPPTFVPSGRFVLPHGCGCVG